jgi:hypothetical protein
MTKIETSNTVDLRALDTNEIDLVAGGESTHATVVVFGITLWTFDDTKHGTSWKGPDGVRHTVWKD